MFHRIAHILYGCAIAQLLVIGANGGDVKIPNVFDLAKSIAVDLDMDLLVLGENVTFDQAAFEAHALVRLPRPFLPSHLGKLPTSEKLQRRDFWVSAIVLLCAVTVGTGTLLLVERRT